MSAVKNFIPQVWAAGVLKERDRVLIAKNHCNTRWQGVIRGMGDRVRILSVGEIVSHAFVRGQDIPAAVTPPDAVQWLDIDQGNTMNVTLEDVDDAQAQEGLMAEYRRKMGIRFANDVDQFIFGLHAQAGHTITQAALTSGNVISTIQAAMEQFWIRNVPDGETKYLEVTPEVLSKIALSKIVRDTDNSKLIENGYRGNYMGFDVYVSNNVARTGNVHHCIARTKDAITFASQLSKTELYRPHARFADSVKSLQIYGGKVVQPREMVRLNLTVAAETAI